MDPQELEAEALPETQAPKIIYLQDGGGMGEPLPAESYDEQVTWCEMSIEDDDTKYIRFDLHEARLAAERILLENERMKVAGCSTAAFGYWKEGDSIHPDYECAALHDVAKLYADFASLKTELEALRRDALRWRDIETAPKDGTNILLVNTKGNMATGLWQGEGEYEGWWLRGGNAPNTFFNGHHGPTHWMPLPTPP